MPGSTFGADADLPSEGQEALVQLGGCDSPLYTRIRELSGELIIEGGNPGCGGEALESFAGFAQWRDPTAPTCNFDEEKTVPECCCITFTAMDVILRYDGCHLMAAGEEREFEIGGRRYRAVVQGAGAFVDGPCSADATREMGSAYIVRLRD